MNDDKKLLGVGDTQTLVYAACKAPTNKLEAVLDDCQDWWNRVRPGSREEGRGAASCQHTHTHTHTFSRNPAAAGCRWATGDNKRG